MMKKEENRSYRTYVKRGSIFLALVLLLAGSVVGINLYKRSQVPELPSFVDEWNDEGKIILDEDVPLAAAPKTTTKTTTKTAKQTVTMLKAATKTYSKKRPTTSKTSTKTSTKSTSSEKKITTQKTTVKKQVTDQYKKNSKKKTVVTKTTTTVATTVTTEDISNTQSIPVDVVGETVSNGSGEMDARVTYAFDDLGFEVKVKSSVAYAGHFDAGTRVITLKKQDNTLYHEMGHFLAFIAGNADTSSSFKAVYSAEKASYKGVNKGYVTQNSSEYFAESFKNYTENPSALRSSRPQTYAAITAALNKVTETQLDKLRNTYTRLGIWS